MKLRANSSLKASLHKLNIRSFMMYSNHTLMLMKPLFRQFNSNLIDLKSSRENSLRKTNILGFIEH